MACLHPNMYFTERAARVHCLDCPAHWNAPAALQGVTDAPLGRDDLRTHIEGMEFVRTFLRETPLEACLDAWAEFAEYQAEGHPEAGAKFERAARATLQCVTRRDGIRARLARLFPASGLRRFLPTELSAEDADAFLGNLVQLQLLREPL